MSLTNVFFSEVFGTALLVLFGVGVVANVLLARTKGRGADWLLISFGWGLAVFVGVFVAWRSGAHLNPAVTLGLLASGTDNYSTEANPVAVTAASTAVYLVAEMVGAFIGAVLAWAAYRKHYDAEEDGATVLGTFSTGPEIRSYGWNLVTEVIATFALVYVILQFGNTPTQVGPLNVALLVVAIGASLGGPTGYAVNPARDLGPRLAHAVLPIRHKGGGDWGYAWVPVVGPVVGGVLAGLVSRVF
ncbi:aquaporin family protein [Streptomyces sp. NP160]|uniref:MIP/aquaporin family protein n=1 Tax=Streptomyces sp. NP160 TaxID=2586637 RepID=UPI00111AA2F5|nr:MIP/aquaporin family protein [Streptomyces sp. NP160]TNM59359.1 aquaporin family protein [Streptomyces sp. NP160]